MTRRRLALLLALTLGALLVFFFLPSGCCSGDWCAGPGEKQPLNSRDYGCAGYCSVPFNGPEGYSGGTVVVRADGTCSTASDASPCAACAQEACCGDAQTCLGADAQAECSALGACVLANCSAACADAGDAGVP